MSLAVVGRPDNLRGENIGQIVESDVFDICDRIREIDRSLYIYDRGREANPRYSICEMCADRVERLVYRTNDLDARVVEHLQYLLFVPFDKRFAEAEAIEARREEDRKELEMDTLVNTMGLPMRRQLEHDGFIEHRGKSYAKRGVKR